MDYSFENLDPERFQQFCQSLLVIEHPNLVCFPVGQPDGGRDAVYYIPEAAENQFDFVIFQVKFVRNPHIIDNPHKWLVDIMKQELPKIKRMMGNGAKRYYLITNIAGTAHLDAGSIDIIYKMLNENLNIPSVCLWRDDLNRRLDSNYDLKWMYPELMSGQDMLRMLLGDYLQGDGERRASALRAFVRRQYEIDKQVRFKQIELHNGLLDLFIDVPVNIRSDISDFEHGNALMRLTHSPEHFIIRSNQDIDRLAEQGISPYPHSYQEKSVIGAATLFLNSKIQETIPNAVLEGAPGQGKSTLSQYICQVHRMKFLGFDNELQILSREHVLSSVRLPFKVDFRDFATWLRGQDPFASTKNSVVPSNWVKSLESFLAHLVHHFSGGVSFNVEDLHAIAKVSHLLLVFDGYDEVADIGIRREIVEQVIAGSGRLSESCSSIQIIVTSRPAAFANSPGFPADTFVYFDLNSITKEQALGFADKWCKARRLEAHESEEVKKILTEKLDQPHLRELARNPMQLAILLSLIHTRGASLPDKRTALYYSYIELFFNRESEKSLIVRENRDLLVDIHGYLAWILQSEAESGQNQGSISSERLKNLLSSYLVSEGHDPSLVENLFTGMVERVVALVSRVEGTYEFEVQPLREYFAARYLYESAPNSQQGQEKQGAKPDRFNALARNFYWLNVARFFAGCYSKGELSSLEDSLQELSEDVSYMYSHQPRLLAAMLLSDWVFAQNPRVMHQIIQFILGENGSKFIFTSTPGFRRGPSLLVLPSTCGRKELLKRCFELMSEYKSFDRVYALADLMKANANIEELKEVWKSNVVTTYNTTRTHWIWIGSILDVLDILTEEEINEVMDDSEADDYETQSRVIMLFSSAHVSYCEHEPKLAKLLIDHMLNVGVYSSISIDDSKVSILKLFSIITDSMIYSRLSRLPNSRSFIDNMFVTNRKKNFSVWQGIELPPDQSGDLYKCYLILQNIQHDLQRPLREWSRHIEPWNNLVESIRLEFGERWVCHRLANIACKVKDTVLLLENIDFFNESISLCTRYASAKNMSSSVDWWKKQLSSVIDDDKALAFLFCLFSNANIKVIIEMIDRVSVLVNTLSLQSWYLLTSELDTISSIILGKQKTEVSLATLNSLRPYLEQNYRLVVLMSRRCSSKKVERLYNLYLQTYTGDDKVVLEFCYNVAMVLIRTDKKNQYVHVKNITKYYSSNIISGRYFINEKYDRPILDIEISKKILDNPSLYPLDLLSLAEATCRHFLTENMQSIASIAHEESWFSKA